MFDEKGNIIQWYIDITTHNGIEDGVPYMEDLYLDLIKLASGEVIKKDIDEIEKALLEEEITKEIYDLGFKEFHKVYEQLTNGSFKYLDFSIPHKKILEEEM